MNAAVCVDDALLAAWALPQPDAAGDKEERGRVVVVAGSREMPGAVQLAATAALRAGAGKLAVATAASISCGVAHALPEARVLALPEAGDGGGLLRRGVETIETVLGRADAVLVGPGLIDEGVSLPFVQALLRAVPSAPVVLDALALEAVADGTRPPGGWILTPHAGEMAGLTGLDKAEVQRDAPQLALDAARRWNAVVALKGAVTWIAAPDGRLWRHDRGNAGLGTSGSGDVLAGLVTGLAARGASLEQALVWGVALHARAGEALARERGPLGYLARELSAEVPGAMHRAANVAPSPAT